MKTKIALLNLLIWLAWIGVGICLDELQMPIEGGYTLYVTRGYNNATHKDYGFNDGDDRYALDFASDGCKSWDIPVLAVAAGAVLDVHNTDDNGYGKYVNGVKSCILTFLPA